MTFEEAVRELKAGGKIVRPDVSGVAYIELVAGEYPYLNGVSTAALGSVVLPIQFTAIDVLAQNWEVVADTQMTVTSLRVELMAAIRRAYTAQRDYQASHDPHNAARWLTYYQQLSALSYMKEVPDKEEWPQSPE